MYAFIATITLSDCQVTTNTAGSGGGIFLWEGDNATLSGNDIYNNTANWFGGGVHLENSNDATLINNTIYGNKGSGYGGGGIYTNGDNATLSGNTIYDNTGHSYDGVGGIALSGNDATLSGNTIYSNSGHVGGVSLLWGNSATLIGNDVHSNMATFGFADYAIGGIFLGGNGVVLIGNDIYNNASYSGGTVSVGGVLGDSINITLSDNNIYNNTAAYGAEEFSIGGVYMMYNDNVVLRSNNIYSNTAFSDYVYFASVGGVCFWENDNVTLDNNIIADNQGDGVYIVGGTAHLRHNTLARNAGGSGVYVGNDNYGNASIVLTNTILVGHTVGISVANDSTATLEATLWGADAWANESDWGGSGTILTGTVNVWGNPAFVNPEAGDYHIAENSAAIDAGVDAGVTTDIDGESRPNSSGHDIGADEFSPFAALAVTKQADPDPFWPGELLTYTLRVINTGSITLTTTITDVLPDQVTPGGVRVWTTTLPAPGGIWTEQVVVTVETDYAEPLINVVQVTTVEGATGVYTETTPPPDPRLEVSKQAAPDPVQAGELLISTICVTNTGNTDLHAIVTDTLPAHVAPTGVLTWTPTSIASGDVWMETVVVTVEMGYAGPLTNVVEVATVEGAAGIYTEISQAQVTPMLAVTKQAHPNPLRAGELLTYTLQITNTGNVTLTATITDVLPNHVTPGGVRTWTTTIPVPDGVWTEQVVVTVEMGYAGPLTNVVQVTTAEGATGIYTKTSQAQKLTLMVNSVGNGSVIKVPDKTAYDYGEVVTLIAYPDPAYTYTRFVEWSGDLTGSNNPATITMDSDRTVTATFITWPPWTFDPSPPGGTVTVEDENGDGFFDEGEIITITATPDYCNKFVDWTGDLADEPNPTSIILVSDLAFGAVFVTQTHTLTVNVINYEGVTNTVTLDPPGGVYSCCTVVTLTASSNHPCGVSYEWSGDLTGSDNPATLHINSDKIVTATEVDCLCWAFLPSDGGTISTEPMLPPNSCLDPGTVVTVTATPDYCYQFDGWIGDLADYGTQNPLVLTADVPLSFSASFSQITYTSVTVNTVGDGIVVLDPTSGPYTCSTAITATATPAMYWAFDYWSGATTGSGNPTSFVLDEDSGTILTAHFTQYNMFLPVVSRNG